ncbi:MAG: hypothetical protein GX422_14525 [Deltaproteobacteria bacterium]|jgi:hypothetical protein|nr:hypothetical protein [Deltaproteobacteria bacterium]
MEFDFDVAEIKVNAATDAWGPYRFSLKWALPNPTGDPLASCTVKSFLNGTETTTDLISSSSMASIGNAVDVWFKYPGAEKTGQHILEFTATLVGGGVNRFGFGYVEVD